MTGAAPLRVLYDISLLGKGHYEPAYRTGIHRVVASLAHALAERADVSLAFAAQESWPAFVQAQGFLRENSDFAGVPFAAPARSDALGATTRALLSAERALSAGSLPRKVASRAIRTALGAAARLEPPLDAAGQAGCDVFHAPSGMLPPFRDRVKGVQYVVSVYDLIAELLPRLVPPAHTAALRALRARVGPRDVIVVNSENTKRDVCDRWKIEPERIAVVPLAASPRIFKPMPDAPALAAARAKFGIPDGPYVLGLNSLDPRKNVATFMEAFAAVVARRPDLDLHLVLVWNGSARVGDILPGPRNAEIRKRVTITGYVPDEDIAAVYSGARVFVHPSRYEGFGLPPLEAMQCGVPVVVSNSSSLPEVVEEAGILIDPDDVGGFADAIERVCEDDGLHARLAAAGRTNAARFTWAGSCEALVAAYGMQKRQDV